MAWTFSILIVSAYASQYSPGVMERVIDNRQEGYAWAPLPDRLPPADGYIAVEDCRHIGDVWWLRRHGTIAWERFLVADCSGDEETSRWLIDNNILVEIGHRTAVHWDTVGEIARIERRLTVWTASEEGFGLTQ